MIDLINGDCFVEVPKLKDESLDLVLTDFPYGISFMGKEWDKTEEGFFFKVGKALLPKMKELWKRSYQKSFPYQRKKHLL